MRQQEKICSFKWKLGRIVEIRDYRKSLRNFFEDGGIVLVIGCFLLLLYSVNNFDMIFPPYITLWGCITLWHLHVSWRWNIPNWTRGGLIFPSPPPSMIICCTVSKLLEFFRFDPNMLLKKIFYKFFQLLWENWLQMTKNSWTLMDQPYFWNFTWCQFG